MSKTVKNILLLLALIFIGYHLLISLFPLFKLALFSLLFILLLSFLINDSSQKNGKNN